MVIPEDGVLDMKDGKIKKYFEEIITVKKFSKLYLWGEQNYIFHFRDRGEGGLSDGNRIWIDLPAL